MFPAFISNILSRVTLRFAVILAVFLGLGVTAMVLVPYQKQAITRDSEKKTVDDHKRLTEILSVILSEPVWQITPEIAKSSSEVVYSDPRASEIRVITLPDRKVFITVDERKATQKASKRSLTRQITHGDQVIGEVELTLADDIMQSEIEGNFTRALAITGISFVLSIFCILMVLHWRLVKPIKLLIEKSDLLANGELNEAISFDRKDEIGHLALSLEATRQALQRSFNELEVKNQQLLEYSGTLESKVRLRTQELESANHHLEAALASVNSAQNELARIERMAALGSMVAGVAHELNTPLGNCLLVASTLSDETRQIEKSMNEGTMRRSDLSHYVAAANESSKLLMRGLQQAAQLVGDFKQVAVDQSSAQRRKFSLLVVFQELAALLHSSLRKTPFTLELDIPDSIELDSYPGPLGQVFSNLVNNAVVHGLDGYAQGYMRCLARKQGDHVLIVFEDSGKGIPPAIIKRIFEPFFTTKFGKGGSGLGLSITFNIITNVLGGEIRVTSEPNQGARFEISLPLIAPGNQDVNEQIIGD
ncbi:HAMP domain-containing protein [Undibacterium sp. LX40W]|nr:ATP-binding protein [Undibacterium sp. LX40W]MBC3892576.1 HAMP domain-containing protein [Undibacterium sp. LX40W]